MKVTSITTGRKVGDKISNRASNKKKRKMIIYTVGKTSSVHN